MKRSQAATQTSPTTDTVTIPHDPVNEQVVIAAAMASDELRDKLTRKLRADAFLVPLHRQIWTAFLEMSRRKLAYDPATVQQILGATFDMTFLAQLQESRPDIPPNLEHHVEWLEWDHARFKSIAGPIAQLLEAVKDNRTDPQRVRGLARQVAGSFDGYGDRRFLRDGAEVVREQVADIRARMAGRSCYQCGLPGLDYYEKGHSKEGQSRLIPGFKPGKVSVIVGVPGGGKSLFTTRLMCGFAQLKKKVLCGAWEMEPGEILELAAIQSLIDEPSGEWAHLSRNDLSLGKIDEFTLDVVERRMEELREWITFMELPFNRSSNEKKSNDANLDLIQGYISDSGCEIFVADLFKRALRYTDPDDEEQALIRTQAMLQELNVHGILVQQLRMKDLEARADKRPTRESIKGSGAWIEVPDNIFGIHRPGLWKNVPDDHLDLIILKQRFGPWPMQVQFACNVSTGRIGGGTTVEYMHDLKNQKPTSPSDDFLADDEDKPKVRRGR